MLKPDLFIIMKKIEKSLILVSVLTVFITSYVYADNMKMNDSMMHGNITNAMMKDQMMDYPLKQIKHGVLAHDVKCNTGFKLILKSNDESPACVKTSSANVLVMRGWAMNEYYMTKTMNQNMTNMPHQMSQPSVDESKYPNAPALVGISDYINTTPAKLAQDIKGKVVVYDFWTFNCINCIHTLPHVVDLNSKYLTKGVLVIGIHSPETVFEKDPNNVKDAVHRYNIQYPVVTDNEFQTWNAFGN